MDVGGFIRSEIEADGWLIVGLGAWMYVCQGFALKVSLSDCLFGYKYVY